MARIALLCVLIVSESSAAARVYHVATTGSDAAEGTAERPLRSLSAAAQRARPGDTILVHQGTYRERVNPPRGGTSEDARIVYQAAPGEQVMLKGSEVIRGWTKVQNDTWKVSVPNGFFGEFNPYADLIHGDWFWSGGRDHHTGAVYLNGHWLVEAAQLDDVLQPVGAAPQASAGSYLLNVAWIRWGAGGQHDQQVAAARFAAQSGIDTADCSEGGRCIGWIEPGDWVRYDRVDLGTRTEQLEFRAASATAGGVIEIREDSPAGQVLGACAIPNTGGWQEWASFKAKIRPTGGERTLCLVFKGTAQASAPDKLWFAKVSEAETTIWAQFQDVNPNEADVEINVRQAVFYPEKPGINYIAVRGFTMMHAATPWAPPTAEQIGLLGTHWSKGWLIENNEICYSTCAGITLGKYGDQWDNTSQNTAGGYVQTIERAAANGWTRERIGHHIVRNNRVAHCEQAGIVGSLGAAYSVVTGNEIRDIHVRRLFTGAEMAGIKFHGAIDTEISGNHIHHSVRGIWLDWMSQGTRVTRNLLHDNGPAEDLFLEVNHGPYLVDHNLLLSPIALLDMSQGGAFAHNLFAGRVIARPELERETPFHPAHTTAVAGLRCIQGGDTRFFNNIFVGFDGLAAYDAAALPMRLAGNVFLKGAAPGKDENAPLVLATVDPQLRLVQEQGAMRLQITVERAWAREQSRPLVTTELLGQAKIPGLPYERPDGTPYRLDTDWHGNTRNPANPVPGPFEFSGAGEQALAVWPIVSR